MENSNFQAVEVISIPEDKEIQTLALPKIKEINLYNLIEN